MSSTPQSQFVELRDLSPSHREHTSYDRAGYENNMNSGVNINNEHNEGGDLSRENSGLYPYSDPPHGDHTYNDNDTSSQSPIISDEKPMKMRRRKAWLERPQDEQLTKAGKFYKGLMELSFVLRWGLAIVPVAVLLAIPIIVGAFKTHVEIAGVRLVWFFLWIEIVWLGLWASKLFARFLPYVFRFIVSVVSVSTTKYAGILKALEIQITLLCWSVICLATFTPIMTRNPSQRATNDTGIKHWESIVAKILTACLLASILFLAEKFLIQFIAVSFHKVQYELRILENKWAVQMLSKLLTHSREMFPRFGKDFVEEDYILEPGTFSALAMRNRGSRPGSTGAVTPMQFVNGARRVFQVGAGLVGALNPEANRKHNEIIQTNYNIVAEALVNKDRTEALARRIWLSFVQEGNEALLPEDMLDVFGSADEEYAESAFTFFDEDLNGDISLEEMRMKCLEVGKERRAIAASLKDTDSAIGKLDGVLKFVVAILAVFTIIALLDTSFKTLLATSATTLLSLSFIFSVTCQEIVASLIFLFIKHPFDVSDRVTLNGIGYIVQEMSLMFTILKRSDGTQVQAPNQLLNTLFIENIRRSAAMSENVVLEVDYATTFEKIEALRLDMLDFVQSEKRDFQSTIEITINEFSDLNKMKIGLSIKHKANWQNDQLRAIRRNKWMCALAMALKKHGIVASGPGSGDPANPFVVATVDVKRSEVFKNTEDPFATPSNTTQKTQEQSLPEMRFDPSFGTQQKNEESFDVNLRSEGTSERIDARLPFTILEETELLQQDEFARQGEMPAQLTQASSLRTQTDGLARHSTRGSRLSTASRTLTGRRSSRRSQSRIPDEEAQ